jgi:hypothetical protein
MRYPTKKQVAAFQAKSTAAVITIGAAPDEHDAPEYRSFVLNTIYGPLRLYPRESAIRTRFDAIPPIHPTGPSLNPYSGKWNFEFGLKPTQEELDWAITCIAGIKR